MASIKPTSLLTKSCYIHIGILVSKGHNCVATLLWATLSMLSMSTAGKSLHAQVCPPKLSLPVGDLSPHLTPLHGSFLGPTPIHTPNGKNLNQVSHFCRAYGCGLLTQWHTYTHRPQNIVKAVSYASDITAISTDSMMWPNTCRILAGRPLRNSVTAPRPSGHQSRNRPIFFARLRSSLVLKPLTVFVITNSSRLSYHIFQLQSHNLS